MAEFTEDSDMAKIGGFKAWLFSNGAKFDKIDWPSSNTVRGFATPNHKLTASLLIIRRVEFVELLL
jgi:hypothetical protein